MSPEELALQYTGLVCFVRPQFRFDARAPEVAKVRERHWFWAAIMENRRLYRDALIAALLINIFAMAMPLFTMNVYDRVVPNNAVETLWVLALGITLVVVFNMILSTARSHVVDSASKRVDVRLSAQIMERVLDLRMEGRPVSVGSFAANLRSFESIRDFIASATITTLVDLPFILLFLLALVWISPWMVLPPLVAIVLILLVSLAAQARMEALTMASFQASSQRNATLVEALTGLEAVKTLNAQGAIQRNWERATEFIAQTGGKLKLISSSTVGFVAAVQQLVSISVVVIGVYQAQESAISMGGIIAASMIAGRCLAPLGQVAGLLMQYQNARTSLASIDNYMKLPIERPAEAEFLHRPVFHGALEFRDVTFAYPGSSQPALKKVSFKIKPGERSASSAASARARPRWKSWPWRCTSPPRAPCCWTAWTCARSIRPTCAAPSATCRRIRCCSMAASSTTWPWARPMRTTPASWPRPTWPACPSSPTCIPMASTC